MPCRSSTLIEEESQHLKNRALSVHFTKTQRIFNTISSPITRIINISYGMIYLCKNFKDYRTIVHDSYYYYNIQATTTGYDQQTYQDDKVCACLHQQLQSAHALLMCTNAGTYHQLLPEIAAKLCSRSCLFCVSLTRRNVGLVSCSKNHLKIEFKV